MRPNTDQTPDHRRPGQLLTVGVVMVPNFEELLRRELFELPRRTLAELSQEVPSLGCRAVRLRHRVEYSAESVRKRPSGYSLPGSNTTLLFLFEQSFDYWTRVFRLLARR